ncbi:MAG: ABC transporter ATP-binding protein [Pirellula sp.]|nr:ABC transporter ATP-binding protein [Pirellula sp.]
MPATHDNPTSDRTVAVACRGVTKEFGDGNALVRALRGVDLDIYNGELSLLVGPSGCGKTTLLSVVCGILYPTAGSIHVFGTEITKLSSSKLVGFRGDNVGFVFQQFNLLPALTAVENVCVPLLLKGVPRRHALEKAYQMLEKVNLRDRADAPPSNLSGGQQQRVAIARALIREPRLMVCDEPTSALDARTGHTIMELLREISIEQSRAVVVVTHDPRVYEFGDRIATMEDGRVVGVEEQTPKPGPPPKTPSMVEESVAETS